MSKKDTTAYLEVARLLGKAFDEILFIDDSPENVSTAQTAGLEAVVYESTDKTIKIINEIINNR